MYFLVVIPFIFIVFFSALLLTLYNGVSILYPLLLGLLAFTGLCLRRGYHLRTLLGMMWEGMRKSLIVIRIFVLIGAITAVWRMSGTVAFIVYYSIQFMNASYFILLAFWLPCLISFLTGTSFGTVGTIGVILIILAQSGNVDGNLTAGAILAGCYFGDRCSPMSSSANLVAILTNTRLYTNLSNLFKTAWLPFALASACYAALSPYHPLFFYNSSISAEIARHFHLHPATILPAAIVLAGALFRVDVKRSMGLSILSGMALAFFLQEQSLPRILRYTLTGFELGAPGQLSSIISGGGLLSMCNVACVVLLSSAYAGLFAGTGILREVETACEALSERIGIYPGTLLTSIAFAAFSCNQTLAVMLTCQFNEKIYAKHHLSPYRLAADLGNTVIVVAALVPWNIAVAVPLATLSADSGAIPYAFYLFLLPIVNYFTRAMKLRET